MKKTVFLMGFLMLGLITFGQYTGNKLPSGLTVADTASDADYTIIQKSGETYVKAIRMDSLRSYMIEAINEVIINLDSVAGDYGQFVISNGTGFLSPVSARYEGDNAYTFGSRLTGTIGYKSMVIGTGKATASYGVAIGFGSTAAGDYSFAVSAGTASGEGAMSLGSGSAASGDYSLAVGASSEASGKDAVAFSAGLASGIGSMAWSWGESAGTQSTAFNGGISSGSESAAWNGGIASGAKSTAWNGGTAQSFYETCFGLYGDTASTKSNASWVATDRLFTIQNGVDPGSKSNALVMLKNGNTTVNGNWTFNNNITADTITGYVRTMSSFGEMYVADGATPQSIANGTTYVKMTGFVNRGSYENMTVDTTNDKIIITETGYYLVNISMSSISGTNGVVSRTAAFLNNAEVDKIHAMQTITNTASPNPVSCSGIIKVETVPVDLDVRRRHDNGAPVTFTLVYGNLSCHKIAEL